MKDLEIKETPFVEKCMEEFAHDFGFLYGDPKRMGWYEPAIANEKPPYPNLQIKDKVRRWIEQAYARGEEAGRKKVRDAVNDFIQKNS